MYHNARLALVLIALTTGLVLAGRQRPMTVRIDPGPDDKPGEKQRERGCGEKKEDGSLGLALLVGCTEYKNHPRLRELYGPTNDVKLWGDLLTDPKDFAFAKENVTLLVGWPDEEAKRPTYANIVKGFERLIEKAKPESRVFVLLSGHGMQVPISATQLDPLDPKNPEPDGLDEVFLPADVGDWSEKDGLKNALLDDQIGAFLDKLRAKGAHVLIVFDCCHSGTMTRGGDPKQEGIREINRTADEKVFGVTDKFREATIRRAAAAVAAAKMAGSPIPAEAMVTPAAGAKGSLVAFYAAGSFEEAPELPFPDGAPILRENYYGMLSWTMAETLKARRSPLSYGQLQRLVSAGYRSARGTRPPTPFAEGDLNREVLGLKVWPKRQEIYISKDAAKSFRIDVGLLNGVTRNSILSVHPRPGSKEDEKTVLAHTKVTDSSLASSAVVPVQRGKDGGWEEALADAGKIPDSGRCQIVVRDFGDMRVKLFTKSDSIKKVLAKLHKDLQDRIQLVDAEQDANWLLRVPTAKEAKAEALKTDHVYLAHGEGIKRLPEEARRMQVRKVYGGYAMENEKALVGALELDLSKVFKWENLWRVSRGVNVSDGGETHGLELEMLKLRGKDDATGERSRDGELVREGQWILWRVHNRGSNPLWVTALYLDANLGIQVVHSAGVGVGKEARLAKARTSTKDDSVGQEGMVVFAVPQADVKENPNFRMLEQEPLRVANKPRDEPRGPRTPFDRLLHYAAFNDPNNGSRGMEMDVSSTPAILTLSWVVAP